MRIFKTESIWDKENSKWLEIYAINSQEVEPDIYFQEIENEEYLDDEESIVDENNCDGCCDNCNCETNQDELEDDECDCPICREEKFFHLLTGTLNIIQDADGCPDCTIQALLNYTMEFQDLEFRLTKK
jgi:hypothetical protein